MKEPNNQALRAALDEVERLRAVLVRVCEEDRHGRMVKANPEGGFRGRGGMIAAFALTGKNGSHLIDEEIRQHVASLGDPTTDRHAEGRLAGEPWVPKLGDPVKVREGSDWASDWQRIELWVAGVSVDERGRGVNVTVAEQWPVPMRHSRDYRGLTDDFIVARTDGLPDDLEPAIRAIAKAGQS